jgi:hypothetical protein
MEQQRIVVFAVVPRTNVFFAGGGGGGGGGLGWWSRVYSLSNKKKGEIAIKRYPSCV